MPRTFTRRTAAIGVAALGAMPLMAQAPDATGTDAELRGLVHRLAAIEEIKRLRARYFRSVDAKDWDAFRNVFTDDAVFYRSDLARVEANPRYEEIRGADAIVAWISERLAEAVTVHFGFLPDIEILSPDRARGIWTMEDRVERGDQMLHGAGYYDDSYALTDRGWRISSFRIRRLRVELTGPAGS